MDRRVWLSLALVVAVAPACATKKFVRTSVGEVNAKVDSVGKSLEETQGRVKQNETRIGEVDSKAESAAKSAAAAGTAASNAAAAAKEADTKAVAVNNRVSEVEKFQRRMMLEISLTEEQGSFESSKVDLPDAAKVRIDEVINRLKADPKNVFIEIEGHTDSMGDPTFNHKLGLDRAEAVKKYIYDQHKVPLHRINVISFGEDRPIGDNKTKEGRAQNRRVVIRVLA